MFTQVDISIDFHVTFTANHWSNLEKYKYIFNVIIFSYLSAKTKELGRPERQRSLIIADKFIKAKTMLKWND